MKIKTHIVKLVCLSSSDSLLTDHCSGVFLKQITQSAILAVVLGVTVVLATGCSATGNGFNARIISPVQLTNRLRILRRTIGTNQHGAPHLAICSVVELSRERANKKVLMAPMLQCIKTGSAGTVGAVP